MLTKIKNAFKKIGAWFKKHVGDIIRIIAELLSAEAVYILCKTILGVVTGPEYVVCLMGSVVIAEIVSYKVGQACDEEVELVSNTYTEMKQMVNEMTAEMED